MSRLRLAKQLERLLGTAPSRRLRQLRMAARVCCRGQCGFEALRVGEHRLLDKGHQRARGELVGVGAVPEAAHVRSRPIRAFGWIQPPNRLLACDPQGGLLALLAGRVDESCKVVARWGGRGEGRSCQPQRWRRWAGRGAAHKRGGSPMPTDFGGGAAELAFRSRGEECRRRAMVTSVPRIGAMARVLPKARMQRLHRRGLPSVGSTVHTGRWKAGRRVSPTHETIETPKLSIRNRSNSKSQPRTGHTRTPRKFSVFTPKRTYASIQEHRYARESDYSSRVTSVVTPRAP